MDKQKLFLIDGMSQLYRSFFAIRRLSTSKGMATNALYGFTMAVRKLIKDFKPEYLAICWDTPEPTVRHQASESYKANRAEMPDDLIAQLPYVERICAAYHIPFVGMSGYEADDVIGTMSKQGAAKGLQVFIISNDKDMGQLVNDDVCVMKWDKTQYIVCGRDGVKEWLGVYPEQVIDLLGLMGDSADNVPGAPGIGEKGAVQLIEQFGSIEEALKRSDEVTRKTYRESLKNHVDQIKLSKQLVTIHTDLPLQLDWEHLKLSEPDAVAAFNLFTELEFAALAKEFAPKAEKVEKAEKATAAKASSPSLFDLFEGDSTNHSVTNSSAATNSAETGSSVINMPSFAAPDEAATTSFPDAPNINYQTVTDKAAFDELLARVKAQSKVVFAIPASDNAKVVKPVNEISLGMGNGEVWRAGEEQVGDKQLWSAWADICGNEEIAKIVFDAKQALTQLNNRYQELKRGSGEGGAVRLANLQDDLLLAAYLVEPERNRYILKELALEYLGISDAEKLDAADVTARLAPILRDKLAQWDLTKLYKEIELPLIDIIYEMEQVGVAVDIGTLSVLSKQFEALLDQLVTEIYILAGQQFNINSPQQLGEVFEKLNYSLSRKTKTGRISTSADVLEELAAEYELPRKIIEYRELAKLKNTYVDALPKLINPDTGRLHTTLNQTIAATGRLSSTNPNLQNIPIRTATGRSIRQAFVAGEGYVLLSADYSQIELRLLAHITDDAKMTEAFTNNEDIHTKTAREVFGARTDEELKAKRRMAKATNFGIAYGVGAFGLAQRVGITRGEAKEAIENYYATYTGVRRYMAELPEQGRRENGVVRTLFGRIRRLPDLNNRNHNLRARAEREAINAPIQGTAADLVKLAMIKIYKRLKQEGLKARMLLQVHDELLLEVPPQEVERVGELVKHEMENVYPLKVPLLVDVRVGNNWLELK